MTEEGIGLPFGPESALRAERNLLNRIKLMLAVQPPLQKYFRSLLTQITCVSLTVPMEGRLAIVTDAGRDAVDAGGALDEGA
jgi:hypothetical protein